MSDVVYTLGPKFSYSYSVCSKVCSDFSIECLSSIEKVFEEVSRFGSDSNYVGIVPVENLINGSVRETFVGLKNYKVKIVRGFDYKISHCLAGNFESLDKVKKILSHPQALAQSSEFLKKFRDDGVEIVSVSSTSKALEMASKCSDGSVFAIGSVEGAEFYGLDVFERNIGNNSNNVTRFIEIRKDVFLEDSGEKTSMIIEPREDRAGLLFEILAVFKIKDINLTKIESLPTGGKIGEYFFYIDVDCSLKDAKLVDAIEFLESFVSVYLFGSYDVMDLK